MSTWAGLLQITALLSKTPTCNWPGRIYSCAQRLAGRSTPVSPIFCLISMEKGARPPGVRASVSAQCALASRASIALRKLGRHAWHRIFLSYLGTGMANYLSW